MFQSLLHFIGLCPDAWMHWDILDLTRMGISHAGLWWEIVKLYISSFWLK